MNATLTIWKSLCLNRNSHALNHPSIEIDSGHWWWSVYELLISMFLFESSFLNILNLLNNRFTQEWTCGTMLAISFNFCLIRLFAEHLFYQFTVYTVSVIGDKMTFDAISFMKDVLSQACCYELNFVINRVCISFFSW